MIASIKAEFRKITTIRSTYLMISFATLFLTLSSFFLEGFKGNTGSSASLVNSNALETILFSNAPIVVLFVAIIPILLMAHEYRYNTVMYTLTANASRTKVFISKAIVAASASALIGFILSVYSVVVYFIGISMRGEHLPVQDFNFLTGTAHLLFYFASYGLLAFLIAVVIRSLVGAIAFYFIYPATIEQLFGGLVLKSHQEYLPFTALNGVINNTFSSSELSPNKSVIVTTVYLVIFSIIGWLLFAKRDAN